MKRSLVILLLLLLPVLAQEPMQFAGFMSATVVEAAECSTLKDAEDTDSTFYDTSFDSHHATMFTAGSSYDACRVDVRISRNASATNDFWIEIRNVTLDTIVGTSATNAAATVATGDENADWETFTFSPSVSLTSGTTYFIDVRRATSDYQLYWDFDEDSDVELMITGEPGTWTTNYTTVSGMFRTYAQ